MTWNSSIIKFLFICFFVFSCFSWFFSGFLKEAVKVWKTFFFFLIAPTFFSPFLLFWASDFLWNSHRLLCLYTRPLSTCSDLFQLRSVSHPMHNFEFWFFYECIIIGNSEPMNLPQSFGCLLLPSVSCTFSCNAHRESVDAVQDRIRGIPQFYGIPKTSILHTYNRKLIPSWAEDHWN